MTTQPHGDGITTGPDDIIGATVRALRSAGRVDVADLARHLGISRQAFYNRLNGTAPWLARDVAILAEFFGCTIQDLFEGHINVRREGPFPGLRPVTPATIVTGSDTRR